MNEPARATIRGAEKAELSEFTATAEGYDNRFDIVQTKKNYKNLPESYVHLHIMTNRRQICNGYCTTHIQLGSSSGFSREKRVDKVSTSPHS